MHDKTLILIHDYSSDTSTRLHNTTSVHAANNEASLNNIGCNKLRLTFIVLARLEAVHFCSVFQQHNGCVDVIVRVVHCRHLQAVV